MMRTARRGLLGFLGVTLLVAGGALVANAATTGANASSVCPNVGKGTGCAYMVTVNPNGTVAITAGSTTPIAGSDDYVVGVVNNSNGVVHSVTLSGTGKDDMFGFDGDEICTYNFTGDAYCATNDNGAPSYTTLRGTKIVGSCGKIPYDAEGPDNTFSGISTNKDSGTINFNTSLPPQGSTYLSLEAAPTSTATGTAVITPGLVVIAPTIAGAVEGAPFTGQVTTFTDAQSISPSTGFTATINWGDGSTPSTGTVGGSAGSYTVSGSHPYALYGTYYATVTVTDAALALNTATSPNGTVSVADAALTAGPPETVSPQETGQSFATQVATFTDADTNLTTSAFSGTTIAWGDGNTSTVASGDVVIGGGAGSFTVTGMHSYGASGTTAGPVVVTITDGYGTPVTVTDNNVTVADLVTVCSGGCNPTLTSGSVTVTDSTDNSGDLFLSGAQNNGQLSCGDGFSHAPTVISESNTFADPSGTTITSTESFPVADAVYNSSLPGNSGEFSVCFSSPGYPFTDITGASVTTGLLVQCNVFAAVQGPCANYVNDDGTTVTEQIIYPAIDASSNDPQHV